MWGHPEETESRREEELERGPFGDRTPGLGPERKQEKRKWSRRVRQEVGPRARAGSAFPLGRGKLGEVLLLARVQLGKARVGGEVGKGR